MGNLVLSRKKNERVRLLLPETVVANKEIWVSVADLRHDTVRIGFNADKDIAIEREEIIEDEADESPDTVDQEHYCEGAGDA